MAPNDNVLAWHRTEDRQESELWKGSPTRALRMRFLLREREPDGSSATLFVNQARDLIGELQTIKHQARTDDLHAVAAMLMSLETILLYLLGPAEL